MSLINDPHGKWLDLKAGAILSMSDVVKYIQEAADTNLQRLMTWMFFQPVGCGGVFDYDPRDGRIFQGTVIGTTVDNTELIIEKGAGLTSTWKFLELASRLTLQSPNPGQGLSAFLTWCQGQSTPGERYYVDVYLQYVREYVGNSNGGLDVNFKNGLPVSSGPDAKFLTSDQIGADTQHFDNAFFFDSSSCYWFGAQTGLTEYNPLGDKSKVLILLYPNSSFSTTPPDGLSGNVIRINMLSVLDGVWSMNNWMGSAVKPITSRFIGNH